MPVLASFADARDWQSVPIDASMPRELRDRAPSSTRTGDGSSGRRRTRRRAVRPAGRVARGGGGRVPDGAAAAHFEQGRLTLLATPSDCLGAQARRAHGQGGDANPPGLEAAGADVFLDAATVHGLLPDASVQPRILGGALRRAFSGVVTYCVGDAGRSRPAGAQFRPVLVLVAPEARAAEALRPQGPDGARRHDPARLHRLHDERPADFNVLGAKQHSYSKPEQKAFRPRVRVRASPDGSWPRHAHVSSCRGWTHLERRLRPGTRRVGVGGGAPPPVPFTVTRLYGGAVRPPQLCELRAGCMRHPGHAERADPRRPRRASFAGAL